MIATSRAGPVRAIRSDVGPRSRAYVPPLKVRLPAIVMVPTVPVPLRLGTVCSHDHVPRYRTPDHVDLGGRPEAVSNVDRPNADGPKPGDRSPPKCQRSRGGRRAYRLLEHDGTGRDAPGCATR